MAEFIMWWKRKGNKLTCKTNIKPQHVEIAYILSLMSGADLDRCNRGVCYGQISLTKYQILI